MGSLRVGHDWATSLSLFTFMHWRKKWQPTPVFLPGESQGRGSLAGCYGVAQSRTRLKWLSSSSSSSSLALLSISCSKKEGSIKLHPSEAEPEAHPSLELLLVRALSHTWMTRAFINHDFVCRLQNYLLNFTFNMANIVWKQVQSCK